MLLMLPRPLHGLLIEARVSDTFRSYEIVPAILRHGYRASMSAGQIHWTDSDRGPSGEPITEHREWILTSGRAYIGSFRYWDGPLSVHEFFQLLRAEILDTLEFQI